MSLKELEQGSKEDAQLQLLITALKEPQHANWFHQDLQTFAAMRNELTTTADGLILTGPPLVFPLSLREQAMRLAHRGHQGLVKTKQLIREKLWFPGIKGMVDGAVKSCLPCQATVPQSRKQPVAITTTPNGPWEEVSLYFCGRLPDVNCAMVLVDDFSHYPVIHITRSASDNTVVPGLQFVFAQFVILKQMRTDNEPSFNGA